MATRGQAQQRGVGRANRESDPWGCPWPSASQSLGLPPLPFAGRRGSVAPEQRAAGAFTGHVHDAVRRSLGAVVRRAEGRARGRPAAGRLACSRRRTGRGGHAMPAPPRRLPPGAPRGRGRTSPSMRSTVSRAPARSTRALRSRRRRAAAAHTRQPLGVERAVCHAYRPVRQTALVRALGERLLRLEQVALDVRETHVVARDQSVASSSTGRCVSATTTPPTSTTTCRELRRASARRYGSRA